MNGQQLKQSIRASEGRVILSETMSSVSPLYPDITNAELAAAFGADLLLLNLFDVFSLKVDGYEPIEDTLIIQEIKKLTGRPVGLNLEPVDFRANNIEHLDTVPKGRMATKASLQEAKKL